MPSSKGYVRNYRDEYDKYQGTEKQKENRAKRNAARRTMEKEVGKHAIKGKDVDHKKALIKGGSNSKSNLRVVSKSANRSFARTKTAGKK